MKEGTILGIKPEWRNSGETDDTLYVCIEDRGDRLLISPLYTKSTLGSIETVPAECVYELEGLQEAADVGLSAFRGKAAKEVLDTIQKNPDVKAFERVWFNVAVAAAIAKRQHSSEEADFLRLEKVLGFELAESAGFCYASLTGMMERDENGDPQYSLGWKLYNDGIDVNITDTMVRLAADRESFSAPAILSLLDDYAKAQEVLNQYGDLKSDKEIEQMIRRSAAKWKSFEQNPETAFANVSGDDAISWLKRNLKSITVEVPVEPKTHQFEKAFTHITGLPTDADGVHLVQLYNPDGSVRKTVNGHPIKYDISSKASLIKDHEDIHPNLLSYYNAKSDAFTTNQFVIGLLRAYGDDFTTGSNPVIGRGTEHFDTEDDLWDEVATADVDEGVVHRRRITEAAAEVYTKEALKTLLDENQNRRFCIGSAVSEEDRRGFYLLRDDSWLDYYDDYDKGETPDEPCIPEASTYQETRIYIYRLKEEYCIERYYVTNEGQFIPACIDLIMDDEPDEPSKNYTHVDDFDRFFYLLLRYLEHDKGVDSYANADILISAGEENTPVTLGEYNYKDGTSAKTPDPFKLDW